MSRLFRLASGIVAGLSLGACSLVTSLGGLEAVVDTGTSGEGGEPPVEASVADASSMDVVSVDEPPGEPSPDDVASSDTGAPDTAPSEGTAPDGPRMDAASVDVTRPTDAAMPPTDSPGGGCSADVYGDPANCGACGHDCQGGTCTSGACGPVTLAVTHGAVGLAIDSAFVYFADNDAGAIWKISKSLTRVGTPTTVVSGTVAQSVQGIAVDGTYVYWTNKTASGQVHRALPTGAALTTIATNQPQPDWIASNGTTVAWTNQTGNQVMAAPAAGDGGVAPRALNVSGENGTVLAGIAIDNASVYYAAKTSGGGLAESVPLAGGAVSELGVATYVAIAIDSRYVYWTGGAANPSVYQNTKAGIVTTQKTIAAGALVCPLGIASDGTNVYFLDQGSTSCGPPGKGAGALYRIPVDNGGTLPPPLVTGLIDPQGIAVDGTAVYWVTGGPSGFVMKLAK